MQLCDRDIFKALINGSLVFGAFNERYPFEPKKQVQPASIDLRLGNRFVRFSHELSEFDIKDIRKVSDYSIINYVEDGEKIIIKPNEIVYGQIYEHFYVGDEFSARIEGRSRVARLGISVHCTGNYINPGFTGTMPLQIVNHNAFSIALYPYIGICQMVVYKLTGIPAVRYIEKGNYNNEQVPGVSIMSSDPLDGIKMENTIKEKRIQKRLDQIIRECNIDNTHRAMEHVEKDNIVQQYLVQIGKVVNHGDVTMGDSYIADQVANQGKNAGKNSTIHQSYMKNTVKDEDRQVLMDEINKLRNHIKESEEYDDDTIDVLVGDLVRAKKALQNKDQDTALEGLKKIGKEIYQIAKSIGCSLLVKYLSGG